MTLIREEYPEVASISVKFNFYDSETDKLCETTEERKLNMDLLSSFKVSCICWECVSGGYDLNAIVLKAIKEKNYEITGSLLCKGWQDKSRINKHRCNTRLEYIYSINYNN